MAPKMSSTAGSPATMPDLRATNVAAPMPYPGGMHHAVVGSRYCHHGEDPKSSASAISINRQHAAVSAGVKEFMCDPFDAIRAAEGGSPHVLRANRMFLFFLHPIASHAQ